MNVEIRNGWQSSIDLIEENYQMCIIWFLLPGNYKRLPVLDAVVLYMWISFCKSGLRGKYFIIVLIELLDVLNANHRVIKHEGTFRYCLSKALQTVFLLSTLQKLSNYFWMPTAEEKSFKWKNTASLSNL